MFSICFHLGAPPDSVWRSQVSRYSRRAACNAKSWIAMGDDKEVGTVYRSGVLKNVTRHMRLSKTETGWAATGRGQD